MADRIVFESARFGRIELEAEEILHFDGLPGFPEARRFVVMEHDRASFFAWLVSVDDPDLAFAIADPWQLFPDYRPPLELHHLRALGVEAPEDLEIMAIANLSGEVPRLNLAAPLLINPRNRRCAQVIFDRCEYSSREPIPSPPESEEKEETAESGP